MITLYLYPSALARDAALDALPAAAWSDCHLTFSEFARRLDKYLPLDKESPPQQFSDAVRQMLFAQALKKLDEADRERISGADAALSAWVELYAAWKSAGLTIAQVRNASQQLQKSADIKEMLDLLCRCFEVYEQLRGPNWLDREDYERQIQTRLGKCRALPAQILPPGAIVEARAFHRLIPFQRYVLERLSALGHAVRIHAPAAFIAQSFRDTCGSLRDAMLLPNVRPPRECLRIEAATLYEEVYEIGRRVHEWITRDGIAPPRIGIAFRDLGPYSQAISDVFKRFEIPFYERRGEPLAFQPLIRVALNAVHACVSGLNCQDLFRFLCAGPVNIVGLAQGKKREERDEEREESGDIELMALHDLAREARIDRFFGSEAVQPAVAWRKQLQRVSDSAQRKLLLAIVERLAAMRATRSLAAHANAWRQLFSDVGLAPQALPMRDLADNRAHVADCIVPQASRLPTSVWRGQSGQARTPAAQLSAQSATCAPDNFQKDQLALTYLHQALNEIAKAPNCGDVSLDDFARCLNLAIQTKTVQAVGGNIGGVRALNLYDLRGLSFERLVIGGMTEGVLPAPPVGNPLLSAHSAFALRGALAAQLGDKTALLRIEPRLPDEYREEEQALFQIAQACVADGVMIFTRPCADADGNLLRPSVFWDTIESDPETANAIHPAPTLAQCITAEERQLRYAWTLSGNARGENADVLPSAAAYSRSKSLQSIANRAAMERARQIFFAQPPPSVEEEPENKITRRQPSAYDGIVTMQAPEAPAILAKLLLAPASHFLLKKNAASASLLVDVDNDKTTALFQQTDENMPTAEELPAISPSALEDIAGCRFRFLNNALFKFRETSEPEETISSRDYGMLWHDVLAKFYREQLRIAMNAGKIVARLEPNKRKTYLDQLQTISEQVLKKAPSRMFIGHPTLFKLEEEKINDTLAHWLDYELRQQQKNSFYPAQVEFEFGPTTPASVVMASFDNGDKALLLKGRMDRLDFKVKNPDDACPEVLAARVIDYKLSSKSKPGENVKVEALQALLSAQLPIYLKAALQYLAALEKDGKVRVDWSCVWKESQAGYYCLRELPVKEKDDSKKRNDDEEKKEKDDGYFVKIKKWSQASETSDDLKNFLCDSPSQESRLFAIVRDKVTPILQGDFAIQPTECKGIWCGARFACRYQAVPMESDENKRAKGE